jgi:hypothetical protein
VLELDVTGLAGDEAYDFGTTDGTFWTAAEADGTYGTIAAAAKSALYKIGALVDWFDSLGGDWLKSYARVVAGSIADGCFYIAAGTAAGTVDITFNTDNAPTSAKIVFKWKLPSGVMPIETSS